jgi:hypothetical protein
MKNSKWNTVPVIDSSKKLVGVFTRSSLYNMLLADLNKNTPILNYIIEDFGTILVDTPVEGLDQILLDSRVGTGIVRNQSHEPVGLLTQNNALKNYLQESNLLKGQLETVLHTSNLGAVMTDEDDQIIFVNSKLCEMIGKAEKFILNQSIESLIPNFQKQDHKNELQFRVRFKPEMVKAAVPTIGPNKNGVGKFNFFPKKEKITPKNAKSRMLGNNDPVCSVRFILNPTERLLNSGLLIKKGTEKIIMMTLVTCKNETVVRSIPFTSSAKVMICESPPGMLPVRMVG